MVNVPRCTTGAQCPSVGVGSVCLGPGRVNGHITYEGQQCTEGAQLSVVHGGVQQVSLANRSQLGGRRSVYHGVCSSFTKVYRSTNGVRRVNAVRREYGCRCTEGLPSVVRCTEGVQQVYGTRTVYSRVYSRCTAGLYGMVSRDVRQVYGT